MSVEEFTMWIAYFELQNQEQEKQIRLANAQR